MSVFTSITVIYNPYSTGPSKDLAEEFMRDTEKHFPRKKVVLVPTKYAAHAEKLALNIAKTKSRPLIMSSSGDGGYHEVVNGTMRSKNVQAITGVLPAGNANDHYRNLHNNDAYKLTTHTKIKKIDLLKLEARSDGKKLVRYAHSYIGFGITPKAGKELNKTKLNQINEVWVVFKTFMYLRSTRLIIGGKLRHYDSLVFSIIPRMSKLITLSKKAKIDDGLFEITPIKRKSKTALLSKLFRAATIGNKEPSQASEFSLRTIRRTLVQLDGEIYHIDAQSNVRITCEKQVLKTVV